VRQSSLAQAFTPGRLNDGSLTHYGFGWGIGAWHGIPCYNHGGAWLGFRTSIRRYPRVSFTVVVAANLAEIPTGELAAKIAELYLSSTNSR
jgi:D-alanyl-D-alanine carboxypeptidase